MLEDLITILIYVMASILLVKFVWEGLPWAFFYDAFFKEDDSNEEGEEGGEGKEGVGGKKGGKGEEEGEYRDNKEEEEKERKRRELCDARVITMEELMNELDPGSILPGPKRSESKAQQE